MQTLSESIDTKNLYEHYLFKRSKEDDRMTNPDSRMVESKREESPQSAGNEVVPTYISAQILMKNEELHRRVKEIRVK